MPVNKPLSVPGEHITQVKKTRTIKTQLVVDEQTLEKFGPVIAKGRVHDFNLFKQNASGIPTQKCHIG